MTHHLIYCLQMRDVLLRAKKRNSKNIQNYPKLLFTVRARILLLYITLKLFMHKNCLSKCSENVDFY